jgi:hypothetical protein
VRILKECTAEERAEFNRLRGNRIVVDYFRACLTNATTALIKATDEDDFRTTQGKAQAIQHILSIIDPESAKP